MVTVVVPAYNSQEFIAKTLDSILAVEAVSAIIISDDASTDTTAEICLRYAQQNQKIRFIQQEKI